MSPARDRQFASYVLVLSPAEFYSGGADVHPAGPRAARADRRARLLELHLAVLLPCHRPGRGGGRGSDAKGGRPRSRMAVRRGLAVLAARRLADPVHDV